MENLTKRTLSRIDELVEEHAFSGVVRVRRHGQPMYERSAGFADRANSIANTAETRFGIASGTKLLTALTVGRLIDAGRLALTTQVRDCISVELPDYSAAITIQHLLTHTSGIPDYYDEELIEDFRTGGRVLVLQRRLHPARCSGGRGNREALSRRRRRGDPQASKNGSLWILCHEPTTGMHGPWLHRRRGELADEHLQPAHRRCLGRRFVLDAGRHHGSLGRVLERRDRLRGIGAYLQCAFLRCQRRRFQSPLRTRNVDSQTRRRNFPALYHGSGCRYLLQVCRRLSAAVGLRGYFEHFRGRVADCKGYRRRSRKRGWGP